MKNRNLLFVALASAFIAGCSDPTPPATRVVLKDRFTETEAKASGALFQKNADLSWGDPTEIVREELEGGVVQYTLHYQTPPREEASMGPRVLVVKRPGPGERETRRILRTNH